jgi:AcrR family transcriptional regulator
MPMGRRGDHSFEELSKMILDAAYDILEEEGYTKLSTRKIATKIGYTVGTLYNVFQNLDDIFIHINGRTLDKLIEHLNIAVAKDSKDNKIKLLAQAYIDFSKENFNIWSTLFEYRFEEGHQIPKWYNEKVNNLYGVVEKSIRPLLSPKHQAEVKEIITVLWSGIHGICILSIKGKLDRTGVESASVLVDHFLTNYMNGVGLSK